MKNLIRKILREQFGENLNMFGRDLQPCSLNPVTGFYRDGYCKTGPEDTGTHTVCARVDEEFLEFTKSRGNDLSTPSNSFPGLVPGDKWCLCALRWQEAKREGVAPEMDLQATNIKTMGVIGNQVSDTDDYLNEQSDVVPGVPVSNAWDSAKKKHVPQPLPTKKLFLRVVKQIVSENPEDILSQTDITQEDRAHYLEDILKLFGINVWYRELTDKIFWAAFDNQIRIEADEVNSFDDLDLRPLKEYKVTCEENWTERVWYQWEPKVKAYSEDDAMNEVYADEDGFYQYWEWENEPGFSKDFGDTEGDGKEVIKVEEIGPVNESRIIKENESPDENELVDGLRDILHKQKEAHSEDSWYNDITKLLKRLNIPLEG